MTVIPVEIWKWLRQEMPHHSFELDFRAAHGSDADAMRYRLGNELPRSCLRPSMADRQCLPSLYGLSGGFHEFSAKLFERTPWLSLTRCHRCGQNWYVACDTVDDGPRASGHRHSMAGSTSGRRALTLGESMSDQTHFRPAAPSTSFSMRRRQARSSGGATFQAG